MHTYRRRGTIEALRYGHYRESADALQAWLKPKGARGTWFFSAGHFVIYGGNEHAVAQDGDWFLFDGEGFSAMKDKDFIAEYESQTTELPSSIPVAHHP